MRVELARDLVPEREAQPVCGFDAQDYAQVLADLLPHGWAWPRDPATVLMRTFAGLAAEFARVHRRDCDLLAESYPGPPLETLIDWERICGLPDPCTGPLPTLQQRRMAVLQKLAARGGQSRAYYIAVAAVLGFGIAIEEFSQFRAGRNRAGDAVYGVDWVYAWRVTATEWTIFYFRAGVSTAGEVLRVWGNRVLECVLEQLKPAHTILLFAYLGQNNAGRHLMQASDELTIALTAAEWNQVMALLGEGPFRIVAPLLAKIRDQAQAHMAAQGSGVPEANGGGSPATPLGGALDVSHR